MWNLKDVVRECLVKDAIDLICIRGIVGSSHIGGMTYSRAHKEILDSAEHISTILCLI